jgi:hypothetical protein
MQVKALASPAELLVMGGRAGVSKSYALCLMTLMFYARHIPADCIIFRRRKKDIYERGGLLRKAKAIYLPTGARFRETPSTDFVWLYANGELTQTFAAIPRLDDVEDYQGPEFGFLGFDEGTHFHLDQITYLMTRRRTTSGAGFRPFIRITCNPQQHGWVRDLVDWYIGEDGFPLEEREGVLRWVVKANDNEENAFAVGTEEELRHAYPSRKPMSMTFLPGRPEDNPFLDWDEYYKSFAMETEWRRQQLIHGNWNVGPYDPTKIWELPAEAIFKDDDEDFQGVLRHCRELSGRGQHPEIIGCWDYGTNKALFWGLGILEPGTPPTWWMIGAKLWETADAVMAARDRVSFLQRLAGELDIEIDPREVQDAGDPSGFASDSMGGWAKNLKAHGVRLVDIRHIVIGRQRPTFLNTPYGRAIRIKLVQDWLTSGQLRIRQHPSCNILLAAIRNWAWDVPEGMAKIDVNHDLKPRKDRFSHPADGLTYGAAFVHSLTRGRLTGMPPAPPPPSIATPRMSGRGMRAP